MPNNTATKPVVLLAEVLSPATIEALGPDFDVREVDGTDREALFAALADADAVLVRSATRIDAEWNDRGDSSRVACISRSSRSMA